MIKNSFQGIIFLALVLLFAFDVYYFLFPKINNCSQERSETEKITVNKFQEQVVANVYKNELHKVNNGKLYFNEKYIELYNLKMDFPILVFRFSLFNCTVCVNFALQKLQKHFQDFTTNSRIILIYDDENMRVSESMFGKMPYVTKDRYILGLPMEKSNTPFIFLLDSDMKAKTVFCARKGNA
jgi:hypothetical protein